MGESYHPSFGAASSIVNFILCILSALSTTIVAAIIGASGYKTSSSKLVLYLNLSMSIWVLSKLPHAFPDYICNYVGVVYTYTVFQVLTITYFMLKATNTALVFSDLEGTSSADLKLNRQTFLTIMLFPLAVAVPSVVIGRYHKKFEWCQYDLNAEYGFVMYCVIIGLAWVLLLASLKELHRIFRTLRVLPATVYTEVMQQIMGGPALYAMFTVIFFVIYDVILLYAVIRSRVYSDMEEYYIDYVVFTVQYLLGVGYAVIYVFESDTLKRIENYFRELHEFEKAFGSDSSSTRSSITYHLDPALPASPTMLREKILPESVRSS